MNKKKVIALTEGVDSRTYVKLLFLLSPSIVHRGRGSGDQRVSNGGLYSYHDAGVDPETKDCYVVEIWRDRIDFPSQVKVIREKFEQMRMRHTPIVKIGIESIAYQRALVQTTFLAGLPVSEVRAPVRKVHRMYGLMPNIENGRIRFPDPAVRRDSWFDGVKVEYLAFPNGEHDDQLDSLYYAFQIADGSTEKSAFYFGA